MGLSNITDIQLGYIAGLFDGEGSITIQHKSNNRVQLRVGSNDLDIVEKIIYFTEVGSVNGPRKLPSGKNHWTWTTTNQEDVLKFLIQIKPLMSERRQQKAIEAIEILEEKIKSSYKICWYCEAGFKTTTHPTAKCCSKPCSDKYQYFKRTGIKVEPRTIVCLGCEKEFITTQPNAVCCSKLCDQKNRRTKQKGVQFIKTLPKCARRS